MAKRSIVWTKTADIQFVRILEYWVKRNNSTTYSKKLVKLVAEKTRQIAKTPFIYKLTDYKDIRVVSMRNFRILFKVTEKTAHCHRFLGQSTRPEKTVENSKEKVITLQISI